ncbi:helix-turn-helix domain-containing protein [Actinomadura harenae]|uniref:XRE family transcriptional regulator n=1 Tax=Actinomadura harenae TaxID=2483351 RepID=A0A3M2LRZ4_9ACTN|nr:helix-turn-helix transcriptional regulator [Actinomadura harenae]RMI39856.1 XRE family transcriptional regulator [Actinomadura harenae]
MPTRPSPTLPLRRLRQRLAALHAADGRKAAEVASQLGWSASKLTRYLGGDMRKPQRSEIDRLLAVYGVSDAERERILDLTTHARVRRWWEEYSGALSGSYDTYVGMESEAAVASNYEPGAIPGLLQTADYARALMSARSPALPSRDLDDRVAVRIDRQARLVDRTSPIQLWAIIGEEVLHRVAGTQEIMRSQIEHLRTVADLPNVKVQILPMACGVAPAQGPFMILQFNEPTDPEVVYIETPGGDIWVEERAAVNRFIVDFERLVDVALSVEDSMIKLDDIG